MRVKFDYKKVAGSGWLDLFYDLILAGLCWFMSESLSLDGFKKSKSFILKVRNLDPVTDRLPAVGLTGWKLGG